ncbi:MAG: cadherin domain-containing protein, partial [Chloroflexi bacterium]|nr:cadherin domain-containing protein [Chloroflexota bacterium]
MRNYLPVTTLAFVGALALTMLLGVLLPSDNVVFAVAPVFDNNTNSRNVDENTPPGTNIGAPISATDMDEQDLEFGNTLKYSLEGTDAALFDIDSSTGQLITKAPLDYEASGGMSHSVTVRVDDGEDETDVSQPVTITVNDVDEPPAAPAAPTVVSGKDGTPSDEAEESTTSLFVVWHAPENTGPSALDYEVQYKKSTETDFGTTGVSPNATQRTATITGLDADTSYDVRVRATNGENDSHVNWSFVGTGSTNKEGNSPPQSTDNTIAMRNVDENTPAGENIGSPVSASDLDTTTLTYTLGGPDAGLFNFNTRTGQIRTKAPLNHEDPGCYDDSTPSATTCNYYVTVTVVDGAGGSDATGIRIVVGDRTEPASAPARPTVRATENSSTSLDVSWSAPQSNGPDVVNYDVQWRKGSDPFSDDNCGTAVENNCLNFTGTSVKIVGLADDTTYEVRVKADNGERASAWSSSGSGRTSRANHDPIFDDRPGGSDRGTDLTVWRTIDENLRPGQVVGRLFADDEDNDRLTYMISGMDASRFDFNEANGEIRTKTGVDYNYEAIAASGTCGTLTEQEVGSDRCYEVMVEVRDGLDDNRAEVEETEPDDSITVKIGVRDRDEPPSAPTATATSP